MITISPRNRHSKLRPLQQTESRRSGEAHFRGGSSSYLGGAAFHGVSFFVLKVSVLMFRLFTPDFEAILLSVRELPLV